MHESNRLWFNRCKKRYKRYFSGENISVVEFGSLYINGSVRDHFNNVGEYIGIDWKKGKNVDIIALAHKFEPKHKFDTIISSSMLEHDPYWDLSIDKMIDCMKDDGILLLAWQAALSVPHGTRYAPDKKYHALKAELVVKKLEASGIYIHEFHYEHRLYPGMGWGPVVIVGFRNKKFASGKKEIENFNPSDKIDT